MMAVMRTKLMPLIRSSFVAPSSTSLLREVPGELLSIFKILEMEFKSKLQKHILKSQTREVVSSVFVI